MSETSYAQLDWDEHGQPYSRQFGDVYFSRTDGLGETQHVFIDGNHLRQRFGELPAGEHFVIGETGFGTGTNFLCAWQLFDQLSAPGCRLHFVSVEKYPLSHADLTRALALWPQLKPYCDALLGQYRAIHSGFQRLQFDHGRISLTMLIGDALEQLPQLDAQIDAWFLDGFSPAKNPEMWNEALHNQLARLSIPSTTIATFASAGIVRRGLISAGFAMQRRPGHGKKWEMLAGQYQGQNLQTSKPWHRRPPSPKERRAIIIGAGLAGCSSAASLAARGWQVTLIDRHPQIAQEASGNPQGVLYLKLSAHSTPLSQFVLAGFGYTRRLLEQLPQNDWSACGVLQLAFNEKEAQRQAKLAQAFPPTLLHPLDQNEAQALAQIALPSGGLFYPEGGWVHPPALCRLLAEHPSIELKLEHQAVELKYEDGQWHVHTAEQLMASAPVVVLAGAADVQRFAPLPLKRIRGQISCLAQTPTSRALATVVCANGYVAPARDGEHTLGASFDFHNLDTTPTEAEHRSNLELLAEISSDLSQRLAADQIDPGKMQGRAAFRCTSPDYLPIVGPLVDPEAFTHDYAILSKDARQAPEVPCPWRTGLYVNSGHGSRGLISAPLSGELLAAWLENEPLPVPASVAHACHPTRFVLRQLIRGQ